MTAISLTAVQTIDAWTMWLAADPCPAVTDASWLTQPRATVMAAVIAVIGALIAYAGVTKLPVLPGARTAGRKRWRY
jgi:hypothetical protein